MSLSADFAGFFRTQWAGRLVDTCVILDETGLVFDDATGVETPTYDTVYSGACLVRPSSASDTQAGEQQTELRGYTVFIPHDETGVTPHMLVNVTSTRDGQLNGLQFTVRNVTTDTYNHVRRVHSEEAVNG